MYQFPNGEGKPIGERKKWNYETSINSLMGKENYYNVPLLVRVIWYQFPNGEGKQQRFAVVIIIVSIYWVLSIDCLHSHRFFAVNPFFAVPWKPLISAYCGSYAFIDFKRSDWPHFVMLYPFPLIHFTADLTPKSLKFQRLPIDRIFCRHPDPSYTL